jgi:tetratricopeptide (TPR) repeat protein
MSNIDKLKKKAAEFEQKKQYQKALELYQQVLDFSRTTDEERDVPLYNRVGDLHFRLGNSEEAINYYEKAVDLYADGGFFNNAIALCNKILRYSPNRSIAYYKLGLISAKKGFNSDAKQNFLEYADRMQKVGKLDEAFRALKEFADLCPGQDDVRLMLAEQLARADRKPEALEQLQLLYDTLDAEGRTTEATATVERMKTLDPGFTPKKTLALPQRSKKDGLVFLDLGYNDDVPAQRTPAASVEPVASPAGLQVERPSGLDVPPGATNNVHDADPGPRQRDSFEPLELAPMVDDVPTHPVIEVLGLESSAAEVAETVEPTTVEPTMAETPSVEADAEVPVSDVAAADVGPAETVAEQATGPEAGSAYADVANADASESWEADGDSDAAIPLLHDTDLHDPLAGLDVISIPEDEFEPPALPEREDEFETPARPQRDEEFVDLAKWLEQNRTPQSTRMIAHDEEPEDNQQKDFSEMLEQFKLGVARSVEETDFDSHYDLGIAFREMGLIDEAISAFQKATRGSGHRVRASEALGDCFIEKGQPAVAVTVLERIVGEPDLSDDALIGVFYLLGRAAELLNKPDDAAAYYHRVIAVDIRFRDATERLAALEKATR